MKSQLKKRVENLEAKAVSAAQKQKPENEAEVAASIEALRQGFKAIRAERDRRAGLPLAEQLRISREELEALLTKLAEHESSATPDGPLLDDGLLRLKERVKRSCIQQLEAKVLWEAERVHIGAQPDFFVTERP